MEVVVPIIVLSYKQLIEAQLEIKDLYDILPLKLDPTEVIILWNINDYESVMQMKASWDTYANQHNVPMNLVYFSGERGVDDYASIHVVTSISMKDPASDVDILKDYMYSSAWPSSYKLISFTDTIKELLADGIHLIYMNPGRDLQFFKAFVNKPKLPPSKPSHTVLFSLDHLIQVNRNQMIEQLLQQTVPLFLNTKESLRAALVEVFNQAEKKQGLIHQFKLGKISQPFFITAIQQKISDAIGLRFTSAQLKAAWYAQYPDAETIEGKLNHFSGEMHQWRSSLTFKLKAGFVLEATSLDIEILMEILYQRNVPFRCKDGRMTHIAGIPVYISCYSQMERVELIKTLSETQFSFKQFSPNNPQCKLIYVTTQKISSDEKELKTIGWHVHAVHDEWDGVINEALKESVAALASSVYSRACLIQ